LPKTHFLLIIPLLITSIFYIVPAAIPYAHATTLTGVVCIAKDGSTSCPPAPPLINSTATFPPPLRVAVAVNSSAGLEGFDITLFADHTILKPWKIDLTNTVLGTAPVTFLECIGGRLVTSAGTCASTDTADTIHLLATAQLGSPPTNPPTTGLLFTAIYNVSSPTFSTPITFQTGCSNTSVSGGVCVTIANGTPTPNAETTQSAKFSDQPYFDLQTWYGLGSLTVEVGGTSTSLLFLNATIVNGFSGSVTLTSVVRNTTNIVTPLPILTGLPKTVKINSTSQFSFGFNCCQVNVTVSRSVLPGTYMMIFNATSTGYPTNTLAVPLIVPKPTITIPAPSPVTFNVTISAMTSIIVKSVNNFTGITNVTLAVPNGLNASFTNGLKKIQLNIPADGLSSTSIRLNSTIYASYVVNLTATSGALIARATLTVNVVDFKIFVTSTSPLNVPIGTTLGETVNFEGTFFPYTINVAITKIFVTEFTTSGPIAPSSGLTVSCSPTTLLVTNSTSTEAIVQSTCSVTGNQLGNYTVTLLAVGGKTTHAFTFPVIVIGPDYTISVSTQVQQISVGSSATMTIAATATKLGCACNVTFATSFIGNPASPPTVTVNPTSVLLSSASPNQTVLVSITTADSTPTGTYYVLVSTNPGHKTLMFAIAVSSTTSPHDLAIYSVTPSTTSTSIGSKITITVVVQNLGKVTENSTVIAIAGDENADKPQNITVAPGQNMTLTFTWDTSGWASGAYLVGGKVLGVPGETIFSNNLLRSATPVTLSPANTSLLESPYFAPSLIGALIVIIGVIGFFFLQARRRPMIASEKTQPPSRVET
jgi:hypothetical protein